MIRSSPTARSGDSSATNGNLSKIPTWGSNTYAEHPQDQTAYEQALSGENPKSRQCELCTSRLTHRFLEQMLTLSLFSFYSPTEDDYYIRANVTDKPSHAWTPYPGSNHFGGKSTDANFAQYQENGNVFMGARYHW
uniref:Uncharacterized protein n=1 Tax=Candidatus Kentrum eta TaxID=2126337 RepID=A0A450VIG8_9GAMM|nr:MAG: hypothetical protein BECKH772A_GA0070896_101543 [Candidatus Kentron sp. H]VFJ99293.1 MAG: hypothetical protein BECKH772B_GA0070898_101556 [Candidatus Kentron sp. H]VFK04604.1 MAG: hypothetical protein BECKH772C_GA0070978_101924 [Candidatus Kentron sp. H]